MGRSQETFHKKEVRNKKEKKRKEKLQRKIDKKDQETSGKLADMIMYVDENGNFTSTPPDPEKKKVTKLEDIEISIPKKEELEAEESERKGIVAHFNESKGYGFIRDITTRESIFVHVNNVLEEIREGNSVLFEIEQGPKGPTAVNVKISK